MLSFVPSRPDESTNHSRQTLGKNIKRIRLARGIDTQTKLARLLDVPQPQASDWENDRYKSLDTLTLLRIAKKLKVSLDQLVEGIDAEYDEGRRTSLVTARSETQILTHKPGGSDVPASGQAELEARVRELEAERKEREAFIRQVQDAAIATVRLFGYDAIAKESRAARTAQRRSRRTRRKAG